MSVAIRWFFLTSIRARSSAFNSWCWLLGAAIVLSALIQEKEHLVSLVSSISLFEKWTCTMKYMYCVVSFWFGYTFWATTLSTRHQGFNLKSAVLSSNRDLLMIRIFYIEDQDETKDSRGMLKKTAPSFTTQTRWPFSLTFTVTKLCRQRDCSCSKLWMMPWPLSLGRSRSMRW